VFAAAIVTFTLSRSVRRERTLGQFTAARVLRASAAP